MPRKEMVGSPLCTKKERNRVHCLHTEKLAFMTSTIDTSLPFTSTLKHLHGNKTQMERQRVIDTENIRLVKRMDGILSPKKPSGRTNLKRRRRGPPRTSSLSPEKKSDFSTTILISPTTSLKLAHPPPTLPPSIVSPRKAKQEKVALTRMSLLRTGHVSSCGVYRMVSFFSSAKSGEVEIKMYDPEECCHVNLTLSASHISQLFYLYGNTLNLTERMTCLLALLDFQENEPTCFSKPILANFKRVGNENTFDIEIQRGSQLDPFGLSVNIIKNTLTPTAAQVQMTFAVWSCLLSSESMKLPYIPKEPELEKIVDLMDWDSLIFTPCTEKTQSDPKSQASTGLNNTNAPVVKKGRPPPHQGPYNTRKKNAGQRSTQPKSRLPETTNWDKSFKKRGSLTNDKGVKEVNETERAIAAQKIQANVRGRKTRTEMQKQAVAATKVQACIRGGRARQPQLLSDCKEDYIMAQRVQVVLSSRDKRFEKRLKDEAAKKQKTLEKESRVRKPQPKTKAVSPKKKRVVPSKDTVAPLKNHAKDNGAPSKSKAVTGKPIALAKKLLSKGGRKTRTEMQKQAAAATKVQACIRGGRARQPQLLSDCKEDYIMAQRVQVVLSSRDKRIEKRLKDEAAKKQKTLEKESRVRKPQPKTKAVSPKKKRVVPSKDTVAPLKNHAKDNGAPSKGQPVIGKPTSLAKKQSPKKASSSELSAILGTLHGDSSHKKPKPKTSQVAKLKAKKDDASAQKIQSIIRGRNSRKEGEKQVAAITILQARAKGIQVRQHQLKDDASAQKIQSVIRGNNSRKEGEKQAAAVTILQAQARGVQVRQHVSEKKLDAKSENIVAHSQEEDVRTKSASSELSAILGTLHSQGSTKSASIHKKRASSQVAKLNAKKEDASALKIQSVFRGHNSRKKIARQVAAATILQAQAKGIQFRQHQLKDDASAQKIQSVIRGNNSRKEGEKQVAAATILQAQARGVQVRQHVSEKKLDANDENIAAQSQVEDVGPQSSFSLSPILGPLHSQDSTKDNSFHKRSSSSLSAILGSLHSDSGKDNSFHKKRASSQVAKLNAKKEDASALKIQSVFRGHNSRKEIARQVAAATVLQAQARGIQIRQHQLDENVATSEKKLNDKDENQAVQVADVDSPPKTLRMKSSSSNDLAVVVNSPSKQLLKSGLSMNDLDIKTHQVAIKKNLTKGASSNDLAKSGKSPSKGVSNGLASILGSLHSRPPKRQSLSIASLQKKSPSSNVIALDTVSTTSHDTEAIDEESDSETGQQDDATSMQISESVLEEEQLETDQITIDSSTIIPNNEDQVQVKNEEAESPPIIPLVPERRGLIRRQSSARLLSSQNSVGIIKTCIHQTGKTIEDVYYWLSVYTLSVNPTMMQIVVSDAVMKMTAVLDLDYDFWCTYIWPTHKPEVAEPPTKLHAIALVQAFPFPVDGPRFRFLQDEPPTVLRKNSRKKSIRKRSSSSENNSRKSSEVGRKVSSTFNKMLLAPTVISIHSVADQHRAQTLFGPNENNERGIILAEKERVVQSVFYSFVITAGSEQDPCGMHIAVLDLEQNTTAHLSLDFASWSSRLYPSEQQTLPTVPTTEQAMCILQMLPFTSTGPTLSDVLHTSDEEAESLPLEREEEEKEDEEEDSEDEGFVFDETRNVNVTPIVLLDTGRTIDDVYFWFTVLGGVKDDAYAIEMVIDDPIMKTTAVLSFDYETWSSYIWKDAKMPPPLIAELPTKDHAKTLLQQFPFPADGPTLRFENIPAHNEHSAVSPIEDKVPAAQSPKKLVQELLIYTGNEDSAQHMDWATLSATELDVLEYPLAPVLAEVGRIVQEVYFWFRVFATSEEGFHLQVHDSDLGTILHIRLDKQAAASRVDTKTLSLHKQAKQLIKLFPFEQQ